MTLPGHCKALDELRSLHGDWELSYHRAAAMLTSTNGEIDREHGGFVLCYRLAIDQPAPADKQSLGQAVFRSGQRVKTLGSSLCTSPMESSRSTRFYWPGSYEYFLGWGGVSGEQGSNPGSHIFEANALHWTTPPIP